MDYYQNEQLNKATELMIKLMPSLKQFFKLEEDLNSYSKRISAYKALPVYLKRQAFFRELVFDKINRIFNKEELKNIDIKLPGSLCMGVVDHHGILDHPTLFSTILVANYYKLFQRKKYGDILSFATGNLPLAEPFRRRGFMFGGRKINLYEKKDKNKIIYSLPVKDFDIVGRLQISHEWHLYSKSEQGFLMKMNNVIQKIDFSNCKYLEEQLTKINFYLYPYLFEKKLRKNLANLITLDYDDIVCYYLINVIKNDKDSFIYKIIFENKFRNKFLTYFNGMVGASDEEKGTGTHLFWGIDQEHKRLSYKLEGESLISSAGDVIELNEKAVINALEEREILPGMILKFSLILFYMGMKPLTGFGSAEYLSRMKKGMIDFLRKDFPEEADNIEHINIDGLVSIPITLTKKDDDIVSAHAFDIFYDQGLREDYLHKVSLLSIKNFMSQLLVFYSYAISKYGSDKEQRIKFNLKDIYKPLADLFKD